VFIYGSFNDPVLFESSEMLSNIDRKVVTHFAEAFNAAIFRMFALLDADK
jgi:hypothetical protein